MTNYETTPGTFYKSLMAGLFTGIVIVLANLIFSFIYRTITTFNLAMVVNIVTINFFCVVFSMVAALLYYFIVPYSGKSKLIYTAIWLILMVGLVIGGFHIHRSDVKVSEQLHFCIAGILVITYLFDAFLIPYMATHKNPVF